MPVVAVAVLLIVSVLMAVAAAVLTLQQLLGL